MPLFLSPPSAFIPPAAGARGDEPLDQDYALLHEVFGVAPARDPDGLTLPRAEGRAAEELAAAAALPLLAGRQAATPDLLVDCRSSPAVGAPVPTYRLAERIGVRSGVVFSLSGQGGAEVGQALLFLHALERSRPIRAVVTAVQRVVPPDSRDDGLGYPLGDGAAAVVIGGARPWAGGVALLGIEVGQGHHDLRTPLERALESALGRAGLRRSDLAWAVAHRRSDPFAATARALLPSAAWPHRSRFAGIDFGCADVLISLSALFCSGGVIWTGPGCVFFAGRFGAVAVAVVAPTPAEPPPITAREPALLH